MNWNQFKNKFRKEALHQKQKVDADAIWDAIAPQLDALHDKDKNRHRFAYWLFFGLAIGLFAAWYFYRANLSPNNETDSAHVVAQQKNSDILDIDKQGEHTAFAKKENKSEDIFAYEKVQKAAENLSSNSTSTQLNNSSSNVHQQPQNSSPTTIHQAEHTTSSPKVHIKTKPTSTKRVQTSKTQSLSADDRKTKTPTPLSTIKEASTLSTSITALETITLQSSPFVLPSFDAKGEVVLQAPKTLLSKKEKPSLREKPFQFSLEVLAGLSYTRRSLKQKTNDADVLFANRHNYESSLESRHIGIGMGLHYRKQWQLTIGLQQTAIAERYTLRRSDTDTEMVEGIVMRRINLDGDTINIWGEVPLKTTTTYDKNIYNTYRLLDVPIILSYNFRKGKWRSGIEAGILANLSLKTEGIIPDDSLNDIILENEQSDVFKSKIGIGYYLGMSLSRLLTDKVELRIAPALRYYPTDFTVSEYPLSQKYWLLGASTGLRYRF